MTIFDEISFTNDKIKKVQDKLEYLQMNIDSPRTSVMSDMPRGGGSVGNPLELYVVKKEELTDRLRALEAKRERLWEKAIELMDCAGIDKQVQDMMYYRFGYGLQWQRVATALNEKYPDGKWNVNKCFRKYREVLCKIKRVKRAIC